MALQSMTGFSRRDGQIGRYQWAWELRSVNGKGLDARLRLPAGFDRLELEARRVLSGHFTRGNIQAGLTLQIGEAQVQAIVNQPALDAVLALKSRLAAHLDPAPLRLDTLLGIRGVIDFKDESDDPAEVEALDRSLLDGLASAADGLKAMREAEGAALSVVLLAQVATIEDLAELIEKDPSRRPDQIRARLDGQVAAILEAASSLDRDRLYTEVALIATKADIREELDRLGAHIAAARSLIAGGGPVGRKLDFLSQEFNREANTLCSKSNDVALTAIGLDLKAVIDQLREQVQNVE
jgi:uncharacterized protein (TIGR00255 family)